MGAARNREKVWGNGPCIIILLRRILEACRRFLSGEKFYNRNVGTGAAVAPMAGSS